jgi:hypothetical protein
LQTDASSPLIRGKRRGAAESNKMAQQNKRDAEADRTKAKFSRHLAPAADKLDDK